MFKYEIFTRACFNARAVLWDSKDIYSAEHAAETRVLYEAFAITQVN